MGEGRGADRVGLGAALITTLTWGMTGVFVHLVTSAPASVITLTRLTVSSAVLVVIHGFRRHRQEHRSTASWAAVAAMAAYYVLATEAFTRAPVVEVTLLVGSSPLAAVCLERVKGHTVSARRLLGVAIAFVGLIAFVAPALRYSIQSVLGDLLALGAAAASALYVTQVRAAAVAGHASDPVATAARASLVGALVSVCLLLLREAGPIARISSRDWWILAMLGTLSTAIPTVAYSIASRRLPASVTTSLMLLTPLFAAVFAGVLLGEWPVLARLPGGALVFAGICVVVMSDSVSRRRA